MKGSSNAAKKHVKKMSLPKLPILLAIFLTGIFVEVAQVPEE